MDQTRLRRRSISIARVALLWVLVGVLLPVLVLVAGVVDAATRARWVRVRLLLFLWVYLSYDLIGVLVASWLALTRQVDDPRYRLGHYRLQSWWCAKLLAIGAWLMQLRFEQHGQECLVGGPILVFMRHTSFIDVLLGENFVARPNGYHLRYVLKRELMADPALDIVLSRLPNCFVNRKGDSARERARVRHIAHDMSPNDAALIYPEGTRFLPKTLAKIQAKFKANSPELYPYCAQLRRVLPPRLGGPFALLDGAPNADVVFVCHTGLDGYDTAKSMFSGEIVGRTIRLSYWRVPAESIPRDFEERVAWMYAQWIHLDRVAQQLGETG